MSAAARVTSSTIKGPVSYATKTVLLRSSTLCLRLHVLPGIFSINTASKFNNSNSKVLAMSNFFSTSATTSIQEDQNHYTIAITGSTGLIGTALIDELSTNGKKINGKLPRIVPLIRKKKDDDESINNNSVSEWNPYPISNGEDSKVGYAFPPESLNNIDAVVHLAGENIATGTGPLGFLGIRPWSDEKKASIVDSRVIPSHAIANAIRECETPTTFIGASGIGVYGCDFIGEDATIADEDSDTLNTKGFLAHISRVWESAQNKAENDKNTNRIVNLRFGVVLSKLGGALAKLYPVFFLGGGGNVGTGKQYFSFISARDVARAIVHTLETPSLKGPVNVCSPNPCTNAEFTSAMGKVMRRPTILPLPEFAVKLAFGEMGEEMLLGGNRVYPKKLLESGFDFKHSTIESALQSAIHEESI